MRYLTIIVISVLTIALQVAVFPALGLTSSSLFFLPLIILSSVIFLADLETAILYGIFLGFFTDLYSNKFFGFSILALLLILFIVRFFVSNYFDHKKFLTLLFANIVAVFVWHVLYIIVSLNLIVANPAESISTYLIAALTHLFSHSVIAILLYRAIPPLRRILAPSLKT